MNKFKIILCAAVLSVLVGCSGTQMAVTGLAEYSHAYIPIF